MGRNKNQSTTVIDQPSMTTIVTKEYLIPPFTEVVIHKRFFRWWTFLLSVSVYLGTRMFNLDMWLLWYHMNNWWLVASEAAVMVLVFGVWRMLKTSPKQHRTQGASEAQRFLQAHPELEFYYDSQGRKYVRQ